MYYPDEILEEVRGRNDIVDVISSYVKLKRSGGTWFGLCPFHNEKTPSFSVTPRKQMFYCFGCHKGGNVITFVQLYENSTFQEAVQLLAARAGVALPAEEKSREERRKSDLRSKLYEINRLAGTYYYYNLRSPQGTLGMDYFKERGLSDQVMQSFGLGYTGKKSDGLYRYLKEKGFSDALLRQSGLVSFEEKRGMYDKFWNRVMFPIMDVNSRIIGFGGRVLGDAKPKYLNSPENEIFNKRRNLYGLHAAKRSREKYLILCEGYMDVIALHQAGFTNAVASLGTALTQEHAALLRRYTDRVILSYDSDRAGVNAALRAIPMLKERGIDVRVLQLAPKKDPDEFIKAFGREALQDRLDNARNSFLFEIDSLKSAYRLDDPDEKIKFLEQVAARIASYELEAQRESYIEAAAAECAVGYDALRQMVHRVLTGGSASSGAYRNHLGREERRAGGAGAKEEGLEASQRLLLGWLCAYPSLYPTLKDTVSPKDFTDPVYREAAGLLYEQLSNGPIREAALMDHFTEPEAQQKVACLLHGTLQVENTGELKKAIRETIMKVAASSPGAPGIGTQTDIAKLQEMVERKRRLDRIRQMPIDLGTLEET